MFLKFGGKLWNCSAVVKIERQIDNSDQNKPFKIVMATTGGMEIESFSTQVNMNTRFNAIEESVGCNTL